MRHLLLLLSFLSFPLFSQDAVFPWVVYYSDQAPSQAFEPYNPIIFDSETHIPLEPLLKKNKEILGYFDVGEASLRDPWFALMKDHELLIRENPFWPGSWLVDIRSPFWKKTVLEEIIPNIFSQGFTGLFLDQIDVLISLEKEDPVKYKGMSAAAIDFIHKVRELFPFKRVMLNRAYEILSDVGKAIDYVLAETLFTSYDFKEKKYYVRPDGEFEWQLLQLNSARFLFPNLVVFSLDYWDPKDKEMYKKIYEIERKNCIRPYVSTILLDQIISE